MGKPNSRNEPSVFTSMMNRGKEEARAAEMADHFMPTFAQESFKAQLHQAVKNEKLDLELLLEETRKSSDEVKSWCKDRAFVAWVKRSAITTAEGQLTALVGLSLTALAEVLAEQDPKFNGAKVSAARLVLEAAKLLQSKSQVVVKDERIARATKEELLEIVRRHKNVLEAEADE